MRFDMNEYKLENEESNLLEGTSLSMRGESGASEVFMTWEQWEIEIEKCPPSTLAIGADGKPKWINVAWDGFRVVESHNKSVIF
jgi:hypothetical protein